MTKREALLARLDEASPSLQRLFSESLPPAVQEELGSVTLPQLKVLTRLAETGPMTVHDLAISQGVGTSAISQMVERLVRLGLVERSPGVDDRRVVRVCPTERALCLSRSFSAARRRGTRRVLAVLSDDELAQYVALTERLVERARDEVAPAPRRAAQRASVPPGDRVTSA